MEFNYITNPETGRKVNIYGKTGQRVLNNYLQSAGAIRSGSIIPPEQFQRGGAIRSGSIIPPEQFQRGGSNCKKFRKTKDPKCEEQDGCYWETGKGCLDRAPVSIKEVSPKKATKKSSSKVRAVPASAPVSAAAAPVKKSSKGRCSQYKKTVDPKCNYQEGCHWEVRKGCVENSDDYVVRAPVVRAPMKASADVKPTGKRVKSVTTKAHGKTDRLSAGEYYRTYGNDESLGDRCDIRKNKEYRCLLKRSNGVAYWAKKSKSGAGQEACEDWSSRCQDTEFA
jgi:hypothetical protein